MKKNKKEKLPKGKSAATKQMQLPQSEMNVKKLTEISQATTNMNIILSSPNDVKNGGGSELSNSLISQNYDLAARKITSSFEEAIAARAHVTLNYLSVQISLHLYEEKIEIKHVYNVIKTFVDATWDEVSRGISVSYTRALFFEPVVYINKILPAVTISPEFIRGVNSIYWEDLFGDLVTDGQMVQNDRMIVKTLIEAVQKNLDNGYHVQLVGPIVLKTQIGSANTVMVYSREMLKTFNKKYKQKNAKRQKRSLVESNAVNHFAKTEDELSKKEQKAEHALALEANKKKAVASQSAAADKVVEKTTIVETTTVEKTKKEKKPKKVVETVVEEVKTVVEEVPKKEKKSKEDSPKKEKKEKKSKKDKK